jgi:hypothetical protein
MRHTCCFLILIVACVFSLTYSFASPGDPIVIGSKQKEYLVIDPDDVLIPVTVNAYGYNQAVRRIDNGYVITVTTDIRPVIIDHPFVFKQNNLPEVFQCKHLINNLATAETVSDALRACLGWLDSTVEYLDDPDMLQNVDAVMERKSGNCVGRSNVLITLLQKLDIKANAVRGALYRNNSLFFHRWIEVAYNDIGFLPTSPGATQDFISPDHIILLPSEKISSDINALTDANVSISVLGRTEKTWITDYWPVPKGFQHPIARRPTKALRYQTILTGEISPPGLPADVELKTNNQTRTIRATDQGTFSFSPVIPGQYRLTVRVYDQEGFRRTGHLNAGEHLHVFCNLIIRPTEEEKH